MIDGTSNVAQAPQNDILPFEVTKASATTTDLGATGTNVVAISGTTTITSFGSTATTVECLYFVRFTGILTLTYNASSMILPGSASITTAAGDTALFKYEGSGNWRCMFYTPISGTLQNPITKVITQTFTGSGTYTPTTGMRYCTIECWGGGGGGGGVASSSVFGAAGGGGAGSYSRITVAAVTVGASKAVTIGAAGAAGTAGNNNGGNGGDTSVGTICVGKGGSGGIGTAANGRASGGAGGIAGTGDIAGVGSYGGIGINNGQGFSGYGGSTNIGQGGNPQGAPGAGTAGAGYGAGGSGGFDDVSANQAGGAGTAGYVIVTEYVSA